MSIATQTIDFLPEKYLEASAERRTRYYRVVVVASFLALLGIACACQFALESHVRRELDQVSEQYRRVRSHANRLAALEQQRVPCEAEAQLYTRLRGPWPRTQIVRAALDALPPSITLLRLRIDRQAAAVGASQASPAPAPGTPNAEEKLLPAERDLRRLRQDSKSHETVVELEGLTDQALTLHAYLGKLASLGLFSAAELTSIESIDKSTMSRFRAHLVVAAGHADAPHDQARQKAAAPASPGKPAKRPRVGLETASTKGARS